MEIMNTKPTILFEIDEAFQHIMDLFPVSVAVGSSSGKKVPEHHTTFDH